MKKLIIVFFLITGFTAFGQNKNARASIEVDGVCVMCKQRIEKAAIQTKGVKSADWNIETHQLKLIFDERKTDLKAIQTNIAAVGHDTHDVKAPDEVYDKIHACCKYRDESVKEDHKSGNENKQ